MPNQGSKRIHKRIRRIKMKRDKLRRLFTEIARRSYEQNNGTLKGFGKVAKFYDRNWRPNVESFGGYKGAWNSEVVKNIRQSVQM